MAIINLSILLYLRNISSWFKSNVFLKICTKYLRIFKKAFIYSATFWIYIHPDVYIFPDILSIIPRFIRTVHLQLTATYTKCTIFYESVVVQHLQQPIEWPISGYYFRGVSNPSNEWADKKKKNNKIWNNEKQPKQKQWPIIFTKLVSRPVAKCCR